MSIPRLLTFLKVAVGDCAARYSFAAMMFFMPLPQLLRPDTQCRVHGENDLWRF